MRSQLQTVCIRSIALTLGAFIHTYMHTYINKKLNVRQITTTNTIIVHEYVLATKFTTLILTFLTFY